MESRTIRSTHHFLRLKLFFSNPNPTKPATTPEVSKELCEGMISHSLRQTVGVCGQGLCEYELLQWEQNTGVLQVAEKFVPILWFCLSLIKNCLDRECRMDIVKTGSCLVAVC